MENTVLELKNVSKSFGKRKIIDNISLKVNSGEIFGTKWFRKNYNNKNDIKIN